MGTSHVLLLGFYYVTCCGHDKASAALFPPILPESPSHPASEDLVICIQQLKAKKNIDLTPHLAALQVEKIEPEVMEEMSTNEMRNLLPRFKSGELFKIRAFYHEFAADLSRCCV